jgi:TatD DNase family protein
MNYFDIHSHPHDKAYDTDREALVLSMQEHGVSTIAIGTDHVESKKAVAFAEHHEGMYASVGLHPADNVTEEFDYEFYKNLAQNKKVVAIGECGLDYFYIENFFERDQKEKGITHNKNDERDRQKRIFEEHINLAYELKKPLMLHIRASKGSTDAYDDALEILSSSKQAGKHVTGNVHFFTGTLAVAKQFNELGFTISFPGVITFTHEYDNVVKEIPLSMMHAETDSPYATPAPHRGKRNSPVYVEEVVKKIAELKQAPFDEVKKVLLENAKRVFGV